MHPVTQRLIDAAPARLRTPVELAARTIDDTFRDRVPGLAAEIAFFVLLSLPPLLLTILGSIGVLADQFGAAWQTDATEAIRRGADVVFSADAGGVISRTLDALILETRGSVIGAGFLLTLFSASRVLRVITTGITIAYDLHAERPAWRRGVVGLALTLGAILVGIAIVPFLVAGPGLGAAVSDALGGIAGLDATWHILYWPVAAAVATLLITTLYHFAAPWWTPFRRDVPGAMLAMALWMAGTMGLRAYVARTITADALYQPIAGPLIVLLWLYVSGFAVLVGAELNAEIERKWPSAHRYVPAHRTVRDAFARRRAAQRGAASPSDLDGGAQPSSSGSENENADP